MMKPGQNISILGVPMDLGGGLRGVDMGPSAVRIARLKRRIEDLGFEVEDRGNVPVSRPESRDPRDPSARFLREIVNCCVRLKKQVERVLDDGSFPVVLGGDHSIACGTVAGLSTHHHRRGEKIGLIWFDAHADMNTPESTASGNVHGMPLAACLGLGPDALADLGPSRPMVAPENAVLIGVRSVDTAERKNVRESGVRVFTMREVDMLGMDQVMREAIECACAGTAGFHLSFDVDGCDPSVAPGVGTPVRGGITQREAHLLMEHAAGSDRLLGLEVTEINPILDVGNSTAEVAVELVLSALGKRVI